MRILDSAVSHQMQMGPARIREAVIPFAMVQIWGRGIVVSKLSELFKVHASKHINSSGAIYRLIEVLAKRRQAARYFATVAPAQQIWSFFV